MSCWKYSVHTLYIKLNNAGTKYVRIMKQTAFWRGKKRSIYVMFKIFGALTVYKMWIIQEPNMLELWNELHFEEEKNGEYMSCLKYSVHSLFIKFE